MKKLLSFLSIIGCLAVGLQSFAVNGIDKAISQSALKKGTVAVSVKNLQTGETVYELNSDKLVPPASTQKLVTLAAALDTLGADYKFKTTLYKTTNNELYMKLGADPFLSSKNLDNLFALAAKKKIVEPKAIYFDDYVLDGMEWGEGWQWDDELNVLMPKFGSYNLDGNLIRVVVMPTTLNAPANIYTKPSYPLTFMNLTTTTDAENNVTYEKTAVALPDMLTVKGTVSKPYGFVIPANNTKRYFRLRTEEALSSNKIDFYGKFAQKKLPTTGVYKVGEIEHPISMAVGAVLKDSNNFVAETVFKLAGGKFVNNTGSSKSSIEMFDAFCKKINLDNSDIKLVDGSGVSKNNLMSADFMTAFLVDISKSPSFELYKSAMAKPGEGTLKNRMLYFSDNLRAKTGTLSDISAIAGYITTQKGKDYAFDIVINDAKTSNADKKLLEEYILRAIYSQY